MFLASPRLPPRKEGGGLDILQMAPNLVGVATGLAILFWLFPLYSDITTLPLSLSDDSRSQSALARHWKQLWRKAELGAGYYPPPSSQWRSLISRLPNLPQGRPGMSIETTPTQMTNATSWSWSLPGGRIAFTLGTVSLTTHGQFPLEARPTVQVCLKAELRRVLSLNWNHLYFSTSCSPF